MYWISFIPSFRTVEFFWVAGVSCDTRWTFAIRSWSGMNEPAKRSSDWCLNYTKWKKSSTQLLRTIETRMQMKEQHTGIYSDEFNIWAKLLLVHVVTGRVFILRASKVCKLNPWKNEKENILQYIVIHLKPQLNTNKCFFAQCFFVLTKQMYVISTRPGKPRDLILTNILEEGSSVDEPRSFEQDEQYLDECLKVLDENPEGLRVNMMICRIII